MSYHTNPGPNATYSSSETQNIADPTLGQAITFDTIEIEKGIYLETSGGVGTKIHMEQRGDYMVTISALCHTTTGSNKTMGVWLRYNGNDIPRSNTILEINSGNQQVISLSFVVTCSEPDDYIELYMSGETVNCQILAIPAIVAPSTPVSPACPSIIVSMFQCA